MFISSVRQFNNDSLTSNAADIKLFTYVVENNFLRWSKKMYQNQICTFWVIANQKMNYWLSRMSDFVVFFVISSILIIIEQQKPVLHHFWGQGIQKSMFQNDLSSQNIEKLSW